MKMCGDEQYDERLAMCCDGRLTSIENYCGAGPETVFRCCGTTMYVNEELMCCNGNLDVAFGRKPFCCGPFAFDSMTHMCCDGVARNKPSHHDEHNMCCKTRAYDLSKMECTSDGRVVEL